MKEATVIEDAVDRLRLAGRGGSPGHRTADSGNISRVPHLRGAQREAPDEVVSPDKLDSLLMKIDEMGIKLIDEHDIGEYIKAAQGPPAQTSARAA
jgi:hypothetical protein